MLSMGQMVQQAAKIDFIVGKALHELKRETDPVVALAKAVAALEQVLVDVERMKD